MGRGDIKSKKGKRTQGSYGKCRPKKVKSDYVNKATPKKTVESSPVVEEVVAETTPEVTTEETQE